MTVLAFAQDDPENPLASLPSAEVGQLPFGAAELDKSGIVVNYIDTEPGEGAGTSASRVGRSFFAQVAPWAGRSMVARHFEAGVQDNSMNVVFDCAVTGLAYKVRIHLKTSPILGTYWIFIKKLTRQ
ncbi:MAG: hypothetical protein HYU59_07685 [Magnetospirillum gryphiswaldense]|nr:hypothetical protein [Magnetospirillum gryphiswaldense]